MKKVHTLLIIISILSLCSCQTKKEQSTDPYNIKLVESKKITLPIEDKKEFLSRSIFQYEEDGKEFKIITRQEIRELREKLWT